jgi:L-alanine-DL-glutamate epimerase-like enolase superfamily enzyme
MRITDIEAIPFRLPVRRAFWWAGQKEALGSFVLVKVHTDDGITGLGEATPLPDWGGDFGRRSGETPKTVISLISQVLKPVLLGSDPRDLRRARRAMDAALRGNVYAKNAVDIALHDIAGKAAGVPVYRLLGGKYRDSVPVAHMVGLMPDTEAEAEATGAIADGLKALQIKGGVDSARDVRLIRKLRRILPSHVVLRLDANQGYKDAKTAAEVLRQLDDVGLDYIEQPAIGHIEMAASRIAVRPRVIADESCWDATEAIEVVRARAADCISIYLAKASGISGAMQVAAVAEAAGMACDVNGSIESGIGNAANLQFALAAAPVSLACVIPVSAPKARHPYRVGGNYYVDDIITEPMAVADGALLPLERPGLGVTLDEAKLKAYRLD